MTKATKRARNFIEAAHHHGHIPTQAMAVIWEQWRAEDAEEQRAQLSAIVEALNKGGKYKVEATVTKLQ